jgi:hypothetical protein
MSFRAGARRGTLFAAGVAAIAAALAALGLAPAGAKVRTDSFDGSCSWKGSVKFTPPATNDQQPLTADYTGPGTCTGTLNGRDVSGAKVTVKNLAKNVDGSCKRAQTRDPGTGSMTFPDGTRIEFTSEFNFVATEGTVTLHGKSSGSATGLGNFVTDRTPNDTVAKCAGEGVKTAPLDIMFMTDSPLTSKHTSGGGGGQGGGGGDDGGGGKPHRHLRLAVRPSSTRAGHRTIFRFRVTTSSGRRKNGAVVRFAGHRARSKRGRARIVAAVRRRGRRMARASRPGYGPAKRAVVIR